MNKSIAILFTLIILVGCSSNVQTSEVTSNSEVDIPTYVTSIFNAYKDFEKKYDCAFQTSEFIYIPGEKYGTEVYDTFSFGVQENPAKSLYSSTVDFSEISTDGFSAWFAKEMSNQTVKDFIVATTLGVNPQLDYSEALGKTENLVGSYSGSGHSDLFVGDKYTIYLSDLIYGSPMLGTKVNVVLNREFYNDPNGINTGEYKALSWEEFNAPLNAGEKIVIDGVVKEQFTSLSEILRVVSNEKTYEISFNFETQALVFEAGKKYRFYGKISEHTSSGKVQINLEYFELTD